MPKVLILYDTQTGNTGRMAEAVAEGARSVDGVDVVLKRVGGGWGELPEADAVIIGSPTRSTQPTRAIKTFLSGLSKVPLKGKVGNAFGSYGWSGEAMGIVVQALKEQGVRVVGKGVRVRRRPNADGLAQCKELGQTVAEAVAPVEKA